MAKFREDAYSFPRRPLGKTQPAIGENPFLPNPTNARFEFNKYCFAWGFLKTYNYELYHPLGIFRALVCFSISRNYQEPKSFSDGRNVHRFPRAGPGKQYPIQSRSGSLIGRLSPNYRRIQTKFPSPFALPIARNSFSCYLDPPFSQEFHISWVSVNTSS